MKQNINLMRFINRELIWLKLGGFYPIKTIKYQHLHSASLTFILSLSILYVILTLIHAFLNITDVEVLSEIVTFAFSIIAYIGKILNMFYYRKNLLLLEDMLKNPILTELQSDEEENALKESLWPSKFFTTFYKMSATLAATVHAIYPLIEHHNGSKNFLFMLWLPFNAENHYVTVYFFESLLLISSTWFCITMDALNVIMMDLCAAQFQLLNSRLVRISASFTENEVKDDKIRVQKIKQYIIHHDYIYNCSELVLKTYSIGEFCQVASSVMIVCFGLFKSIVTPIKSVQFLMLVSYSITMIYQVSLYCCFGQKLLDASNTVTEACYMSEWNKCSVNVQQHLVMIMTRANRPVIIKAGGIFTLTLETLMTICTSSYSFFAILYQVYSEE